jgi:hypothetical protein
MAFSTIIAMYILEQFFVTGGQSIVDKFVDLITQLPTN